MTIYVGRIVGHLDDPAYAGRVVDQIEVRWGEASRRVLRRSSRGGLDVAIDLEADGYLADGAVLHDDGVTAVAVSRPTEVCLVVTVQPGGAERLLDTAVRLGHLFGNQHIPLEIEGLEIRVPITTTPEVAAAAVRRLGLPDVDAQLKEVALGAHAPLFGAGRGDEHRHSHGSAAVAS